MFVWELVGWTAAVCNLANIVLAHKLQVKSSSLKTYTPSVAAAAVVFWSADVVGGCMLGSSEARFSWGLASLLSAAPFYAPGAQQLLQQLGPVMEQAQVRLITARVCIDVQIIVLVTIGVCVFACVLSSEGGWDVCWLH